MLRAITVTELIAGPHKGRWSVITPYGQQLYKTAAQALNGIKRMDKKDSAAANKPVISVIRWQPYTTVGRAVVYGLTDTEDA